jgi:hypothetical protein
MSMKRALQGVLGVSLVGVVFSGIQLYQETCRQLLGACTLGETGGGEGLILGYPPCLYGLAMFLTLVAIAAFGLRAGREGRRVL